VTRRLSWTSASIAAELIDQGYNAGAVTRRVNRLRTEAGQAELPEGLQTSNWHRDTLPDTPPYDDNDIRSFRSSRAAAGMEVPASQGGLAPRSAVGRGSMQHGNFNASAGSSSTGHPSHHSSTVSRLASEFDAATLMRAARAQIYPQDFTDGLPDGASVDSRALSSTAASSSQARAGGASTSTRSLAAPAMPQMGLAPPEQADWQTEASEAGRAALQAGRPMELQASASTRGEWALPANGQAVIDARAKLRANAPGVPVDHVNRFVAFVRHLDGLESPISIEAFGPDGTKPIQEQEQFLNDVIAADPAVRAGWRSGVGAVLEIHYEHEPAVVGLRLAANHAAVRAARAKLWSNAPGVSNHDVANFIAFVRHLDGLQTPISIEAFGPDGTEPIQEQERFLNDVIAADSAHRRHWRPAVGAVLEIHYESDPAVVGLRLAANHAAVRAARAKLRADAPGVSNQVVTEFIAFVKHLDGLPVPISIKAFGPDGTEPIQDQEQFLNNEIAADRGHRRNWRAAVRAVLWT